jgi:Na+/H+-translocating membrane pyrophosphatase
MSDDDDKSGKGGLPSWTGKAALAGAAIGSAALAAALLYASRRKERAEKEAKPTPPPVWRDEKEDD